MAIKEAVFFDHTDPDYLSTSSGLSASDNNTMLMSVWVRFTTGSGLFNILNSSTDGTTGNVRLQVYLNGASGQIGVISRDNSGTIVNQWDGDIDYTTDSWYHLLIARSGTTMQVYVNDTIAPGTHTTSSTTNDDWSVSDWTIAANAAGSGGYPTGDMSELYFTNEYLDISTESNRRKFIDANGQPEDLGADGSTPTGTQPLIYFTGDASVWNAGTNAGSGGDFTMSGSVTDSSNEPVLWAADAVDFDGTSDYLIRNSAFLGSPSDNKLMTVSMWVQFSALSKATFFHFIKSGESSADFIFRLDDTGTGINFLARDEGTTIFNGLSTGGNLSTDTWHHILLSVDMTNESGSKIYINEIDITDWDTFTDLTFDWSSYDDQYIATRNDNQRLFDGDIAEVYITNEYLDISNPVNRQKFIKDCKPVFLGGDGSLPTGTQPLIYFTGNAALWNGGNNQGSGGDFTMTGAVADSGNEPVQTNQLCVGSAKQGHENTGVTEIQEGGGADHTTDVDSGEQGHTASSVALTFNDTTLTVYNSEAGHEAGSASLIQHFTQDVHSAEQGHEAEEVVFVTTVIAVDATQGHEALSAALSNQIHQLTVMGAEAGHTAGSADITSSQSMGVISAEQGHEALSVDTVQHYTVVESDSTQYKDAVDFEGSNDYLTANGSGTTTSKVGILSVWIYPHGTSNATIINDQNVTPPDGMDFRLLSNKPTANILTNSNGNVVSMTSSTAITSNEWHHILMCWDSTDSNKCGIWVDDVEVGYDIFNITNAAATWHFADFKVAGRVQPDNEYNGCMSELYLTDEFLDFNTESNRREFITEDLRAINLGPSGTGPTGTQPRFYFTGDSTQFPQNTGGSEPAFTVVGTLTDCADVGPIDADFVDRPFGHEASSAGIAQTHNLTVMSAEQGHTAESIAFVPTLNAVSATMGHTAGSADTTILYSMNVISSEMGHDAYSIHIFQYDYNFPSPERTIKVLSDPRKVEVLSG